jgi:hypothetical protein
MKFFSLFKGLNKTNFCSKEKTEIFFQFYNVEYKSIIAKGKKTTVKDFLNLFGQQRGNLSSKDFELIKGNEYIKKTEIINNFETKPLEQNPLTIIEDKLTPKNVKFRNLQHLWNPLNFNSGPFQQFLSQFILDQGGADNHNKILNIDTEGILRHYRTINKIKSTNLKFSNLLRILLKSLNLKFEYDYTLTLEEVDKHSETGLFVITAKNGLIIPITMVLEPNGEVLSDNSDALFNQAVLNNLNLLRKFSLKNKNDFTFGITTDINRWKFSFYKKPVGSSLEGEDNFLLSQNYDLLINSNHLNTPTLSNLLRIINGLSNINIEKGIHFNTNEEKKHIH